MNLRLVSQLILSLPKTVYFNLHYFKFKDAVKLPIIISYKVNLAKMGGEIEIDSPIRTAMINIGFYEPPFFYKQKINGYWNLTGRVLFKGRASMGIGTKIRCSGTLMFGENFKGSATTNIDCKKEIRFGDNTLVGWDCLFMDTDNHAVLNMDGIATNSIKEITIGDRVWFGQSCTVLKGAATGNDVVVATNSCLFKKIDQDHCVLGGYPAKVVKEGISWRL